MTALSPAYDNKIYQKYSKKNLTNKVKNKIAFYQDFGLKYNKNKALVCLSISLCNENNLGLLKEVIEGIFDQGVSLAVIGVGTKEYQNYFEELAEKYEKQMVIVTDSDENKRKLYAASDIQIVSSKNQECLEVIQIGMSYGVIPVCPKNELSINYNPAKEQGNAFVYENENKWSLFAAFVRAIENYGFPYDWKLIQKNAMESDQETDA